MNFYVVHKHLCYVIFKKKLISSCISLNRSTSSMGKCGQSKHWQCKAWCKKHRWWCRRHRWYASVKHVIVFFILFLWKLLKNMLPLQGCILGIDCLLFALKQRFHIFENTKKYSLVIGTCVLYTKLQPMDPPAGVFVAQNTAAIAPKSGYKKNNHIFANNMTLIIKAWWKHTLSCNDNAKCISHRIQLPLPHTKKQALLSFSTNDDSKAGHPFWQHAWSTT